MQTGQWHFDMLELICNFLKNKKVFFLFFIILNELCILNKNNNSIWLLIIFRVKGCSLPHYLSQLTYNFDPATDRVKSLKHIFLSEQGSSMIHSGRVKIFTFISQVSRALQNRNIALFMFTSHPILMTTKNFRCL